MLLTFKHQHIPPNLHFKNPNPNIPALHDGSFKVVDKVTPFCGDTIAINSFGFGGENVHAVIKKGQQPLNVMSSVNYETNCMVNGTANGRTESSNSHNKTPQPKTENGKKMPSKLVVISAHTEDSAKNLLQLAADHCDEDETLALLDPQINVPPSDFPARGYAIITEKRIVKDTQVFNCPVQKYTNNLWLGNKVY